MFYNLENLYDYAKDPRTNDDDFTPGGKMHWDARKYNRKLENIARLKPDLIAAGNIGCMTQLSGDGTPVVHTVELLDWMAGGPKPAKLDAR